MNISMYFNWSKTTILPLEMKAESQRKSMIATTTQYEFQRIVTNKNELERIQNASPCTCKDHNCDSPWRHDSLEHFNTFVAPPRTLAIFATSNDFFAEPERAATNYMSLVMFFFHWIRICCGLPKKSWQCDLGLASVISRFPSNASHF